ncbi:hypothetical protein AX15_005011 [Amanita polypyramis BW_CC]|nr:hypothetical protein AX15_005011 [Amanita polypyramis BW_CC]
MQFTTGQKRPLPSSNWLALQKLNGPTSPSASSRKHSGVLRKRRKLSHAPSTNSQPPLETVGDKDISPSLSDTVAIKNDLQKLRNGESLDTLRKMVWGGLHHTIEQRQPGKYIAIDCEMVGIGIDGSESSLARVSLVNYYGVVQLDEYVKQREKVVDYRTQYSGIRDVNMVKATPFEEVQKRVAELLKDRIIIGHAIHNDLKALLLSHPRTHLRDTQVLSGKFKVVRSKYIALRNLVKQELGLTIQSGEHSSVGAHYLFVKRNILLYGHLGDGCSGNNGSLPPPPQ